MAALLRLCLAAALLSSSVLGAGCASTLETRIREFSPSAAVHAGGELLQPGETLQVMDVVGVGKASGRRVSPDPLIFGSPEVDAADGRQLNLYAYAANNPVTRTDATGLWAPLLIAPVLWGVMIGVKDDHSGANLAPALKGALRVTRNPTLRASLSTTMASTDYGTTADITPVAADGMSTIGEESVSDGWGSDSGQKLLPEQAGPTGHISPGEVIGQTPAQIDERARQLGLEPRGPDPAGGVARTSTRRPSSNASLCTRTRRRLMAT